MLSNVVILKGGGGHEGEIQYKREGHSSPLIGTKKQFMVSLSVFSFRKSTAGAFAEPFKVLS